MTSNGDRFVISFGTGLRKISIVSVLFEYGLIAAP